jgi:adenine-specific DNA glycosylase
VRLLHDVKCSPTPLVCAPIICEFNKYFNRSTAHSDFTVFIKGAIRVNVAVGIIQDAQSRILIARRKADAHLAGLWEFPGGKLAKKAVLTSGE